MLSSFSEYLIFLENFYWSYIGWILICVVGLYFSFQTNFLQFKLLVNISSNLKSIFRKDAIRDKNIGVHPLKLYFASIGGTVGLGNIVGVSVALMIGGPGSIFWTMVASIMGSLLKYSEIFLGIKYRVLDGNNNFHGGPMYFLKKAFKSHLMSYICAFLICIYSIEVYQFVVLVDRIDAAYALDRNIIILLLLGTIFYTSVGGVKRLANLCSVIMPVFMIIYLSVALYIIAMNLNQLLPFLTLVMKSAFLGQAPVGGFVGSTLILSAYSGISKAVYSGDICIGYDSIIQSETSIVNPKDQAKLSVYALFSDNLICIITNLMLGITGAWYTLNGLDGATIVSSILGQYIPFHDSFITLLLFFAGFTTITAYFTAGIKCAHFISPTVGKYLYIAIALIAFRLVCNFRQEIAFVIMSLVGGILVLINTFGIFKLRKEIEF